MRQKLLEEYKKTLKLSAKQKDVLIGLLLGDGHIELSPNRKSARLRVEYSVKNSDYVEYLHQIFKNLVRMNPRTRTVKGFGKNFDRVGFTTLSLPGFLNFRDLFYQGKTKIVPSNIADLLTSFGLAVWFMDDGSYKSRECKGKLLCTHNFTSSEVALLCQVLDHNFDLRATARKQKDGIEIYINASSYVRFKTIISPFMVKSFLYKLDSFLTNLPKL